MADVDTSKPWLVGYQQRWLADRSKLKVACKSRRIGLSEVLSLEAASRASGVDLATGGRCRPVNQILVSASHDQSKKLLERVVKHLRAFGEAGAPVLADDPGKVEVRLTTGTTISALSSNPAGLRGDGGDVSLDELGSMPKADAIWAAAKSIADPTLACPEGYQIRAAGTPLGDDNFFHRICVGDLSDQWSVHTVTVHDAVRDGFPANVEALRAEAGDPDMFAQEYECAWLSADARYIPAAVWDAAIDTPPSEDRIESRFGGLDLARSQHRSVLVQLARYRYAPNILHVLDVDARRDLSWELQESWIDAAMGRLQRLAVDSTGLGSQFSERLVNRFGGSVLPIDFTLASKERLATGLRLALERKALRPSSDPELRREVLSLRRVITKHGNITYTAPVQRGAHADSAWALALALEASGGAARDAGRVPQVTSPSSQRDALLRAAGAVRDRFGVWRYGAGFPPVRVAGVDESGPGRRPRRGAWR